MLYRIAGLALTIALACTGAAQAVVLQGQNGDVSLYQTWADEAGVPTYSGVVDITIGGAGGACGNPLDIGCTIVSWDQTPQIWVDPGNRQTLLHELGHVFDFETSGVPSDALRSTFAAIWQIPQPVADWFVTLPSGAGPLSEWWAESYRTCADGVQHYMPRAQEAADLSYPTIYGYPGGLFNKPRATRRWALRKQHMVCDLIRDIARSNAGQTTTPAFEEAP